MKTKQRIRLEIKDITADGTFEGILSPYGNVDGGGDIIERGAYAQTLKTQGATRPMLWQHKADVPIGELTLEDRADGLWCKGQLLMASAAAQEAYLFIKAGIVKGLSIGFTSIRDEVKNGIRVLKEIKLFEGAIVTFPMNEQALITSVKGKHGTKGDFNEELTEIQILDASYQIFCALRDAMSSIVWADMSRDEKIAAAQAITQQFSDAHAAWFPTYLDTLEEYYGGMEMMAKRALERKSGRTFSAANKEKLQSIAETLLALIAEDADTSESEAVTSAVKAAIEPEPVPDHSAIVTRVDELRALLTA